MKRLPAPYVLALVLLGGVAVLTLLTWFGVGPFGSIGVFILTNVVGFFALLVLGVLGGAFLGMLFAHRIFSQSEFTPFERTIMQSLAELREAVDRQSKAQEEALARLEAVEERLTPPRSPARRE